MNLLWNYFWPCLAAGLLVGVIAGTVAFRRPRRFNAALALGLFMSLGFAGLWHGPLGAADRFAMHVDRYAREALDYYEMTKVTAHLHESPLTRRLILAGPADDFQTSELARLLSQLPGVSRAQWANRPAGMPLIVEAFGVAIGGFLSGLLLAYLVDLRRRYNAQWTW